MTTRISDKLFYIKLVEPEMYNPGNIRDITHYLLYNQTRRILVDITADVDQAPLLSEVEPMKILGNKEVSLIEQIMERGIKEPKANRYGMRPVTYVKNFECNELKGRQYSGLAKVMAELYEANHALDISIKAMRKLCKKLEVW